MKITYFVSYHFNCGSRGESGMGCTTIERAEAIEDSGDISEITKAIASAMERPVAYKFEVVITNIIRLPV